MFVFVISPDFKISAKTPTMPFNYKLNDSPLVANRKLIETALEAYYSDHSLYPYSLEKLVPEYLPSIPLNPETKKQYNYVLEENGKKYKLCLDESQSVCAYR